MFSQRFCVLLTKAYCTGMHRSVSHSTRQLFACGRWTNTSSAETSSRLYSTEVISPVTMTGDAKSYAPKIRQLVDDISQLTLLEVADLNELLKKTLNITDTPMMAMGAAPAAAEQEEEPEEKRPEKTSFTVNLTAFDTTKKVAIIKQMKALVSGMNLVQAKKFVESVPQIVRADITKEEAEELKKSLEEVGGTVSVD